MGYRSDIAFAIQTEKPIDGLMAVLKIAEPVKQPTEPFTDLSHAKDAFKEIVDCLKVNEAQNMVTFYATQWKWYGDCQSAYNSIMDIARLYDEHFSARFARIGESSDDTEEEAYGDAGWDIDYPYVTRSIEIDSSFKEGE